MIPITMMPGIMETGSTTSEECNLKEFSRTLKSQASRSETDLLNLVKDKTYPII